MIPQNSSGETGRYMDIHILQLIAAANDGYHGWLRTRQALEPDLVPYSGVFIVVAVPSPDGARLVDDPQPPVAEARFSEHRQVSRLMILDEPSTNKQESTQLIHQNSP